MGHLRITAEVNSQQFGRGVPPLSLGALPIFLVSSISNSNCKMGGVVSKKNAPLKPSSDSTSLPQQTTRGVLPELQANWFSRLVFYWVQPILSTGYKRPLETHDLWDLDDRYNVNLQYNRLSAAWTHQLELPKPSLIKAFNSAYGRMFWPLLPLKFISDTSTVVSPLILAAVTKFVTESWLYKDGKGPLPNQALGFALPFILFAVQETGTLCNQHYFHHGTMLGLKVRSALIAIIYRKALVLSSKARQEFTAGKITNMVLSFIAQRFLLISYV